MKNVVYEDTVTLAYAAISKSLYLLGEYQECINVCVEGISHSLIKNISTGLSNFFGYKALAYNKLRDTDNALKSAKKLFMQLTIEDNNDKRNSFVKIINKNLDIDLASLF